MRATVLFIVAFLAACTLAQKCSSTQSCDGEYAGQCCSRYGWCGKTPAYCDVDNGCQKDCNNGGGGDHTKTRRTKTHHQPTSAPAPTRNNNTRPAPTKNDPTRPAPTKNEPTKTQAPTPLPTNSVPAGGFDDRFKSFDSKIWEISTYPPSELFASSWSKDQVRYTNNGLELVIDQQGCPGSCGGKKWRAGEIVTNKKYQYGYFEATFIPACSTGGISSLFTYADAAGGAEIDVEFEGGAKNCTGVSYTHYAGGKTYGWGVKPLGFNAAEKAHSYGIFWNAKSIQWYVDGKLHFSPANPVVPSASMNLMLNNWVVSKQDAYYGKFPEGKTVKAIYSRVAYWPLNALPSYVKP